MMSSEQKIGFAAKGALSEFQGFGNYIASSSSFEKSQEHINRISEIDKEFTSFYDIQHENYTNLIQYLVFAKMLNAEHCLLAIRAKKKFSQFYDQSRAYDRREYFYFSINLGIDVVDFVASLPTMVPYKYKQLGQINDFELKESNYRSDDKFYKSIVASLLDESAKIIQVTESNANETRNEILGSIKRLPTVYKKYIGFGFNIESSNPFVKSNLHVYTTLDESGVEAEDLNIRKLATNDLRVFSEALFSDLLRYDDTEILLSNFPLNRNTLYEMIKFHKLHFTADQYSKNYLAENRKEEFLSESKSYVSTFLTSSFANNFYLLNRIIQIYKSWNFNGLLKRDLFIWFWKRVNESGVQHKQLCDEPEIERSINEFIKLEGHGINNFNEIDPNFASLERVPSFHIANASLLDEIKINYISSYKGNQFREIKEIKAYKQQAINKGIEIDIGTNFYKNIDFNQDAKYRSKHENFEILKNEIDELSDIQILSLIKLIGLDDLFNNLGTEKSEKILRNKKFYEPVINLLSQQDNLTEILKWVSLLSDNNLNASFDAYKYLRNQAEKIISERNYFRFESLCIIILSNRNKFEQADVIGFIEKVITQPDCQTIQFYKTSLELADSFGFKITATHPNSESEQQLMNFIFLFEKYRNSLKNSEILGELTQSFIQSFSKNNHSIEEILNFSHSNLSFVESNKNDFQRIIEEAFSNQKDDEKLSFIISLFKHTIDEGNNLFLHKGNKLYNQIIGLDINDRYFIKEVCRLELKIGNKSFQLNEIGLLISILINKYSYTINIKANFFTKLKNKISFINKDTKIATAFFLLLLMLSICGCIYFYLQNYSLSNQVNHQILQIDSIQQNFRIFKNKVYSNERAANANAAIDTISLNPEPNRELNEKDVSRIESANIKGKSASDIVTIIFSKNPTDIDVHYRGQEEAYVIDLIRRNRDCFDMRNICVCSALQHIPSYRNKQ